MNHIQEIIRRLQLGEGERRIARDMQISRGTVHKYHEIARQHNYLEAALPNDQELQAALGPGVQTPRQASTVEPYRTAVKEWLKQGVEMTAIWLRLQENFGYTGGYSSVRRFVHRLEPVETEAFVRVHSEAGEDLQVDFGTVGQMYDPVTKRLRTAYVFVATPGLQPPSICRAGL
jgi:transposase